jgi:hypothetical protein
MPCDGIADGIRDVVGCGGRAADRIPIGCAQVPARRCGLGDGAGASPAACARASLLRTASTSPRNFTITLSNSHDSPAEKAATQRDLRNIATEKVPRLA